MNYLLKIIKIGMSLEFVQFYFHYVSISRYVGIGTQIVYEKVGIVMCTVK